MMARSSAASRASGATRQALPRLAMALTLVVALGTMGASTAFAAKPVDLVGTIELAGAVTDGVGTYAVPTDPTYGGTAAFHAEASGSMSPQGYLYVRVLCSQEGWIVYQWSSRDLAFAFPLVDQAGDGLEWDGGAAQCTGELIYRVDGKRNIVIEVLDTTAFGVAGA